MFKNPFVLRYDLICFLLYVMKFVFLDIPERIFILPVIGLEVILFCPSFILLFLSRSRIISTSMDSSIVI